jgi:hypothetical protein
MVTVITNYIPATLVALAGAQARQRANQLERRQPW